tara:strand:- start:3755 stop:4279 length:525 start_codon:yes stop_codon:yes gene_type:complete
MGSRKGGVNWMDEIVNGNVRNVGNEPSNPDPGAVDLSHSVDLSQDGLTDTLMSAMLLRGDIRCRLSTKFKCGYEIRPIMWFSKRIDAIDRTLEALGLVWKDTFVKTQDIAKLCYTFKQYFPLSPRAIGLESVRQLNGYLPQPLDHEEVEEALKLVEKISEALRPQHASDKTLRE